MGQIVRRKKKGRPPKSDLSRRSSELASSVREPRRSLRRRNVRYTFDFDDYLDDDEFYDNDEELRRKEKKLRQLLKEDDSQSTRRVEHAHSGSYSSESDEDDMPLKRRKVDCDDEIDGDDNEENELEVHDIDEGRGRKAEASGADSAPGSPTDHPAIGLPMPDKKTLELILDKLQKKDIYGVYAEPVDPDELPDYHDVIKNPMDFATVRRKLGNGSYSNLGQFESDVFLICSNAMQYNSPDTVYHKQASAIQELAKRKFQRLRVKVECSDIEPKFEQKTFPSLMFPKKQAKKPFVRTVSEPVGSDFSSGATLATTGELQNGSMAQAASSERPRAVDGFIVESSTLMDNNVNKGEESLPGKVSFCKFGRKPSLHDENRRATYNSSDELVPASDSILSTFDGEAKQLVPVGLHADHSYARSLARFAATLGSVAWKVASLRIEQALPAGSKYGRGWVGEYEPLPTSVLMLENCMPKEPIFPSRSNCTAAAREKEDAYKISDSAKEHHKNSGPAPEGKSPLFGTCTSTTGTQLPAKEESPRVVSPGVRPPVFSSPGAKPTEHVSSYDRHRNPPSRNSVEPQIKSSRQVELNSPTSTNENTAHFMPDRQISNGSILSTSRPVETVIRSMNLMGSTSFKQPNGKGVVIGGVYYGKSTGTSIDNNIMVTSSSNNDPNQMMKAGHYFPQEQEQSLSDPAQLMRILAEKAQNQQKSVNNSAVDVQQVVPQASSPRREEPNNAALAAARAWMSLGAGGFKPPAENTGSPKHQISPDSLDNGNRDRQPQVSRFRAEVPAPGTQFQPDKSNFPVHAFVQQPVRIANGAQFLNWPMSYPQFVTADLSRFQMQSPWWGVNPQMQPRQKQESHPPDLNIGFQSVGSPGRQSSGVLVDSQQPDLALQL